MCLNFCSILKGCRVIKWFLKCSFCFSLTVEQICKSKSNKNKLQNSVLHSNYWLASHEGLIHQEHIHTMHIYTHSVPHFYKQTLTKLPVNVHMHTLPIPGVDADETVAAFELRLMMDGKQLMTMLGGCSHPLIFLLTHVYLFLSLCFTLSLPSSFPFFTSMSESPPFSSGDE